MRCVFPERRRERQSRDARQRELVARISRLEAVVAKVDPNSLGLSDEHGLIKSSSQPSEQGQQGSHPGVTTSREVNGGNQPRNKYLGSHLWTQLCGEIDGLKQCLDVQSDSEDDMDSSSKPHEASSISPASRSASLTSHAIFANPEIRTKSSPPHPTPAYVLYLADAFFGNVDVVLKIVHRPTFSKLINRFAAFGADPRRSGLDKTGESLMFAMYFGAVTTLDPETCLSQLGETKPALVSRYRLATEIALANADYLNATKLEALQALAIYIAVLRTHDGSRASWALLSLLIRIAQSLNLHRDGPGHAFPPFEAEMRRRLWWSVVILDMRAAEDRGAEPIVTSERFDTQLPTSINDEDFGPDSTALPEERTGPSDITLMLCLAMCSAFHIEISKRLSNRGLGRCGDPAADLLSDDEVMSYVRRLEERFIDGVDMTHLVAAVAAQTTRLIILKLWLDVQYPVRALPVGAGCTSLATGACSRVSRLEVLRTAGLVMELAHRAETAPGVERFAWWCCTYVQWHPLAVALAELCVQTKGQVVERVWRVVDEVFEAWSLRIAGGSKGMLWRPIRKLYKKARDVRATALRANEETGESGDGVEGFDTDGMALPGFVREDPGFAQVQVDSEAVTDQPMSDWVDWTEFVSDAVSLGAKTPASLLTDA